MQGQEHPDLWYNTSHWVGLNKLCTKRVCPGDRICLTQDIGQPKVIAHADTFSPRGILTPVFLQPSLPNKKHLLR